MALTAQIVDSSTDRIVNMLIRHTTGGRESVIDVPCSSSFLSRQKGRTWEDLMMYLNQYWASLTDHDRDRIFAIYLAVVSGHDSIHDNNERAEYMQARITELYELHDLDRVEFFLRTKTNMVIPPDVPSVFTLDEDHNHNEDQTYLRDDYAQLAALSTILKVFIPIWGNYIDSCRRVTGNYFKEYEAFLLLRGTTLFSSRPIRKLQRYIERSCGEKGLTLPQNVFRGITSEDCSFWLTARTCIRRFVAADLSGQEHLIRVLNRAVKQFASDPMTSGDVTLKKPDDTELSESVPSILEGIHRKSNTSPGTKVELKNAMRDIHGLARSIMISLDEKLLDDALVTAQYLETRVPVTPQMTLMRWVMCRPGVLSSVAPDYVSSHYVTRLLAASQAILWQNGFHNLAMLVTAEAMNSSSEFMASVTSSRSQVPPVSIEQLGRSYPHDKLNRRQTAAGVPDIMASIEELARQFGEYRWRATASDSLLEQAYGNRSRTIVIQPDLKEQIAKLVFEIGERSWA